MAGGRINVAFVCGGKYHDMDYARVRVLEALLETPHLRTLVYADYSDIEAICAADCLVTYTVDVLPDAAAADRLQAFVAGGKRWFALHGTNSVLRYVKGKGWEAPRAAPVFMQTLGSQFIAHPPIAPYEVEVTAPEHPLVAGIGPFSANDELYLSELHPPIEVLLHTRFTGSTPGFTEPDWQSEELRPVLYLKRVGGGEVLYFTLGHARSRYDMQPLMAEYPHEERGSWNTPEFQTILRRGLHWMSERPAAAEGS
jgi:type 1 glutamine amidotransferase